jgi:hypothetical protein
MIQVMKANKIVSSYVVGIWGFKISLLLSYIRFMTGNYRIACIVLAVIITMAHIAFICVFIFMCNPVGYGLFALICPIFADGYTL